MARNQKAGAESPTTARELDFDDEPQETGVVSSPTRAAKSASPKRVSFQDEEAPPAKPPRPLSPQVQAENTLIEAFPSIDAKVVKAVLVASGGNVEPAFNALLSRSPFHSAWRNLNTDIFTWRHVRSRFPTARSCATATASTTDPSSASTGCGREICKTARGAL